MFYADRAMLASPDQRSASGQLQGINVNQIVEAATRAAVESATPVVRDQLLPRVLADRQALTAMATGLGRGIMEEAGVVGRFAMLGVGVMGVGVLFIGVARLAAAGKK